MHEPQKKSKNKPKKLILKTRKTFLIYMLTKKHHNTIHTFKKMHPAFLPTP
jgi:hypothetical protein